MTTKLVIAVLPKVELAETYKFVVVAPMPVTSNPPSTLVRTPLAPNWIVPVAPPVPIDMVVVPGPVPRLMVDEVPIPRERV